MPHPGEFEGIISRSGIWTPADASGAGLVLTNLVGRWVLMGNLVWVYASFAYPGNASGANATVSLPFVSSDKGAVMPFVCDNANARLGLIGAGVANMVIFPGGAFVPIINSALGGNTFVGSAMYQINPP